MRNYGYMAAGELKIHVILQSADYLKHIAIQP
jgi:hypothetical protein